MSRFVVFVSSINKDVGRVVVTATNGRPEGPPRVTWALPYGQERDCYVGKRYVVNIDEEPS